MSGAAPPGNLRLRAAVSQGRTVLTEVYRTAPFHPAPARQRGHQTVVALQEVSPGIFPGDRLEASVTVDPGACLVVEAQGAARVYPSPHGEDAESGTDLAVAAGGSLWWIPGVLIPYQDARLVSRVHAHLETGASIALLDILTPGRVAMGERDAYSRLDLRTRIDVAGRPVLIERALLAPEKRPSGPGSDRDAFRCSGALTLVGYDIAYDAIQDSDDVWLGGDGGPDLAVVRGVARSAAFLRRVLLTLLERLEADRMTGVSRGTAAEERRL